MANNGSFKDASANDKTLTEVDDKNHESEQDRRGFFDSIAEYL